LSDVHFNQSLMKHLIELLRGGKVPKLRDLCLSRCSLNNETLVPLLQFLIEENPRAIERLDLSENELTQNILNLLMAYFSHPQCGLQCLSLKSNRITSKMTVDDNNVKNLVGPLFSSVRSNTSLNLLDLSYNNLNFNDIDYQHFEDLFNNPNLVYLMVSNNRLIYNEHSVEAFIHFIRLLPMKLEYLDISYTGIDSTIIGDIYEASLNKPNLKHLSLSDNILGRESCDILAMMLRNNSHLISLNLSDIRLWDTGAKLLANSIAQNTTLRSLKLCNNRVGRSVLDIVNSCLTNNSNLLLDFRKNTISSDLCEQITELTSNSKLRVLLGTL